MLGLYEKGVTSFEAMGDLPKGLRSQLKEHFTIGSLAIEMEQVSR